MRTTEKFIKAALVVLFIVAASLVGLAIYLLKVLNLI